MKSFFLLLIFLTALVSCSILSKWQNKQQAPVNSAPQVIIEAPKEITLWDEYNQILKEVGEPLYFESGEDIFYHSAINYKKLSHNPILEGLIKKQLAKLIDAEVPEQRESQIAFWLNAYNFLIISEIAEKFPLKTSKTIEFKNPKHQIADKIYSINQIHTILRDFKDPRIHFAINLGNISSPSLKLKAYEASSIDKDLDRQVVNALKNPTIVRIEKNIFNKEQANLSKIFEWFEGDFAAYDSAIEFVRKFAPEKLGKLSRYKVMLNYNWNLNTKGNILNEMENIKFENPKLIQEPKLN